MALSTGLERLALFQALPLNPLPTDAIPADDVLRARMNAVSFGKHIGPLYRTPADFPADLH
jgi:hypothetical protein